MKSFEALILATVAFVFGAVGNAGVSEYGYREYSRTVTASGRCTSLGPPPSFVTGSEYIRNAYQCGNVFFVVPKNFPF